MLAVNFCPFEILKFKMLLVIFSKLDLKKKFKSKFKMLAVFFKV